MTGLAQQLFADRTKTPMNKRSTHGHWPRLMRFVTLGIFSYLDYALAERLMKDASCHDEDVALFICYLSLAARSGHLCVSVNDKNLTPSLESLWIENKSNEASYSIEEINSLIQSIIYGFDKLPSGLPCHSLKNLVYFNRHWKLESLFFESLQNLLKSKPAISLNADSIDSQLSLLASHKILLPEQVQSIRNACIHGFCAITGGPGTGKTYTAAHLLRVFWNSLPVENRGKVEIALTAPTGKAAANLQKSFASIQNELINCPPIKAKTLHQLLDIRGSSSKPHDPYFKLSADLLLVDESSMIDLHLMARLFASIKEGGRLVLLGDSHQLPPVEAGALFSDLVHLYDRNLPIGHLRTCLRAELHSIIELAESINSGDAKNVFSLFVNSKGINYAPQHSQDEKSIAKKLIFQAEKSFTKILKPNITPIEQLIALNQFRILSPLRKGPLGIDTLNRHIYNQCVAHHPSNEPLIIPIMIVKNDYRLNLFNGETGILVRQEPKKMSLEGDYAYFPSLDSDSNNLRRLSAALLPRYEYAYCLSVHKSQGSEFDHVLLLMPEGSEIFGREVFYTGVTRAKKSIEIWGSEYVITEAIKRPTVRMSGIRTRCQETNKSSG